MWRRSRKPDKVRSIGCSVRLIGCGAKAGNSMRFDQSGALSDRSDVCQALRKNWILGMFNNQFLSNAFTDLRELSLCVWDPQFEIRLLFGLV